MDGGMENRKVVEVPSDIIASPGVERAIALAGLSPVKGATRHSVSNGLSERPGKREWDRDGFTRRETPSLTPIGMYFSEGHAAFNRFLLELLAKLLATNSLENGVHPLVREDIHQVHTTCIRYIDWCDLSKEQ